MRLLEDGRAAGYTGGYTQLKEYVRHIRPVAAPEPVVPLQEAAWPPGAGSHASASGGACATRCSWFSAIRACCGCASTGGRTRKLITWLEDAFTFFGGVPPQLLFDQMKTVIDHEGPTAGDGALARNAEFLRFANHWGFTPRACRSYRAQTKARSSGRSATSAAISSTAGVPE